MEIRIPGGGGGQKVVICLQDFVERMEEDNIAFVWMPKTKKAYGHIGFLWQRDGLKGLLPCLLCCLYELCTDS